MARIFHGFRIDNCHSTPIHVAIYLLDKARELNPNLYVFAELFTGSEQLDLMFVAKLGINSLIREAMQAWDPAELSRMVFNNGGLPIGSFSFQTDCMPIALLEDSKPSFKIELKGSDPHILFMDCTHDNQTPNQKRRAIDTLPNAAITAMCVCAVGSVKGYDEIVPELLHVVTGTKKYRLPRISDGIIPAKSELLRLHTEMAQNGYDEIYVHQENDFITIHRTHPITHDGYLLVARTAFHENTSHPCKYMLISALNPIRLRNQSVKVFQSASLKVTSGLSHVCIPFSPPGTPKASLRPSSPSQLFHSFQFPPPETELCSKEGCITGLPCSLSYSNSLSLITDTMVTRTEADQFETVIMANSLFDQGSYVVYKTWVGEDPENEECSISDKQDVILKGLGMNVHTYGFNLMSRLGYSLIGSAECWFSPDNVKTWPPGLFEAVEHIGLPEINFIIFRNGSEDLGMLSDTPYNVSGFGSLTYFGLQGFVSVFSNAVRDNLLNHAICAHLRDGLWAVDYVTNRMSEISKVLPKCKSLYEWMCSLMSMITCLPPNVIPKYFALIINCAYQAVKTRATSISRKSALARIHRNTSVTNFLDGCLMTIFQLYGSVSTTGLFPTKYPLNVYLPFDQPDVPDNWRDLTLAAGLPHFSSEYFRCWGRDIFISFRGLFLLPGHFGAARAHLIAFGSSMRHGLIPNLLDQSLQPRFNARDAPWFWINAVADFCRMSPEGWAFLGEKVCRRFIPLARFTNGETFGKDGIDPPDSDTFISASDSRCYTYTNTIAELCHEMMERHARGIHFREYNAGEKLDHAMKPEGFDIDIQTLWDSGGLISGGNKCNCGTWVCILLILDG